MIAGIILFLNRGSIRNNVFTFAKIGVRSAYILSSMDPTCERICCYCCCCCYLCVPNIKCYFCCFFIFFLNLGSPYIYFIDYCLFDKQYCHNIFVINWRGRTYYLIWTMNIPARTALNLYHTYD